MGGDDYSRLIGLNQFISIRTPAWGVTCFYRQMVRRSDFNSHPRVGGDKKKHVKLGAAANFNSHPRVGGDRQCLPDVAILRISIRTPAWGVTGQPATESVL